MKRIICIILCGLATLNTVQAKKLPDFVQQKLDSVKKRTEKSLMDYRIWNEKTDGYMTLPTGLGIFSPAEIFSYEETKLIDSLGLNLSVGMVYDDPMRDRIIQLIRNEYREGELDTLVNRHMVWLGDVLEKETSRQCHFDTIPLFNSTLDSFYTDLKNKNLNKYSKDSYQYEVCKRLQLDTTELFKKTYRTVVEKERISKRESWINNTYYNYTALVKLCGYIGDKRFIKPLIEALEKPDNFQRERVLEALVRMQVEPYYSDYVKKRTLTMEQIKDKDTRLDFSVDDFAYVLGTQKAYLELSKYLLSNKPYGIIAIDYSEYSESYPTSYTTPVSNDAFYLIQDNIENKDLQEMIGNKHVADDPKLSISIYNWMQKNYGKYKIRRIW